MPYKILLAFLIFTVSAVLAYSVSPSKYRYISLLAVSLLCIAFMSGYGSVFIIITAVTSYYSAVIMEKINVKYSTKGLEKELKKQIRAKAKRYKRMTVAGYTLVNLGILALLKYFNFFSRSFTDILNLFGTDKTPLVLKFALPLGISYYTLQALSYVIDVYRGKYKAEKNILKLSLFICFFPQLHEGPFGRYDLLMPQLCKGEAIGSKNAFNGIFRILWGLFKIFMVANRAAVISDAVFGNYQNYGGFTVILGGAAFTLQLYAEFSGYIDIAGGISKIFGIEIAKNFDMPFLAQNIAEFWRRWHISLGAFFRDYVFYPVSTSKFLRRITRPMNMAVSNFVTVTFSLLAVWYLTGLWHGASEKYVYYGLYYFILILLFNLISPLIEKLLQKCRISNENIALKVLRIAKTLFLVLIGMIMFRAENMTVFFTMISSLFKAGNLFVLTDVIEIKEIIVLTVSALIMLTGGLLKLYNFNFERQYDGLAAYKKYGICFILFCIIMIFGAYGLDYMPPDPIYGGF